MLKLFKQYEPAGWRSWLEGFAEAALGKYTRAQWKAWIHDMEVLEGNKELVLLGANVEQGEHQQRVATKGEVKTEGQPAQGQPAQGSGSMEVATEGQPAQGQPAQGSGSK